MYFLKPDVILYIVAILELRLFKNEVILKGWFPHLLYICCYVDNDK